MSSIRALEDKPAKRAPEMSSIPTIEDKTREQQGNIPQ
jgi:hypothetical protein